MKNLLKLKLILIFCLVVSCSKEGNIDKDENQVANNITLNSEQIVFEDENHKLNAFYLDGTSITIDDFNALDMSNYPTTHYDLPNRKVEIFTTEDKYQAYLKNEPELVARIAEAEKEASEYSYKTMADYSEEEIKKMEEEDADLTLSGKQPPTRFNLKNIVSATNHVVIHSISNKHHTKLVMGKSKDFNEKRTLYGNTSNNFQVRKRANQKVSEFTKHKLIIRNSSDKKKSKNFYKKKNYNGNKTVVTFRANDYGDYKEFMKRYKSFK